MGTRLPTAAAFLGGLSRPVRPRVVLDRLRVGIWVDDYQALTRLHEGLERYTQAKRHPYDVAGNRRYKFGFRGQSFYLSWKPIERGPSVSIHFFASACHSGVVVDPLGDLLAGVPVSSVQVSEIEIAVDYPIPPALICPWAGRSRVEWLGTSMSRELARGGPPNLVIGGARRQRKVYDKARQLADVRWRGDRYSEPYDHLDDVRSELGFGYLTRVEERCRLDRAGPLRAPAGLIERLDSFRGFGLIDLGCAAQHDPLLAYYLIVARYRGPRAAQAFFERGLDAKQRTAARRARKARLERLQELSAAYLVPPDQAVALARDDLQRRVDELVDQVVDMSIVGLPAPSVGSGLLPLGWPDVGVPPNVDFALEDSHV